MTLALALRSIVVILGAAALSTAAEPSNTVRIGYPSSAVSTLPFDIAKEKGFYTKAGLNVEYIQMRSALGPQAILNGNIHFFTSPQSAINGRQNWKCRRAIFSNGSVTPRWNATKSR